MQVIVKKWKNSVSVKIPTAIIKAAKLNLNEPVDVREEDGRVIIEPIRNKKYDLAHLLDAITPENLHGEISFGP